MGADSGSKRVCVLGCGRLGTSVAQALARGTAEPGASVSFTPALSGVFDRARIFTELGTAGPDLAAWSALAVLERLNGPTSVSI